MNYSYLALGDSYTIGEAVLLSENFSYQAVQLLRKKFPAHHFYAPEIIAKTGWTTDELDAAIEQTILLKSYNIVSLLIGVNNQYRGRDAEEFRTAFTGLLQKAISFAGDLPSHVFVISIPDWGVTPFAKDRDAKKIALEIDTYNSICKTVAAEMEVVFIDITHAQRADASNAEMLAADGLHPSAKEYAKWAEQLTTGIKKTLI